MRYQVADAINGGFGDTFATYEEAEVALAEAIEEGKAMNLEASGGETDLGSDGTRAEDFFNIIEVTPGYPAEVWGGWVWVDDSGNEQRWSKRQTRDACIRAVNEAVDRLGIEETFA